MSTSLICCQISAICAMSRAFVSVISTESPTSIIWKRREKSAVDKNQEPYLWLQEDEDEAIDDAGLVLLRRDHEDVVDRVKGGPAVFLSPRVTVAVNACELLYAELGDRMDADEPVQGSDAVQALSIIWRMIRTAAGKDQTP